MDHDIVIGEQIEYLILPLSRKKVPVRGRWCSFFAISARLSSDNDFFMFDQF